MGKNLHKSVISLLKKNYHTVNTVIHNTGNDYQLPGIRATDLFARQIQASILQEF